MKKVKILVDKTVFELVKQGRINMLFADPGSEKAQEWDKLKEGDDIKIVNQDNEKQQLSRRFVRQDGVGALYLGKGYPGTYRTNKVKVRIHIDMIIEEDKTENNTTDESSKKKEPAKA